ncbi:DUF1636 family protein [Amycolatopsis thermoflava]|uniref:DUF1636 family protein n=1 Tax=Amycolatopsis thermoflava TaxID=84480 RepID=UPI003646C2C9
MPLLVCRTCPRYDTHRTGQFGHALLAALATHPGADGITVRSVQCLGGCPRDGVVAVDGPGKTRVRFAGLTPGDAEAILEAARAHDACPSGDPAEWPVPAGLETRISSVTVKRPPRA